VDRMPAPGVRLDRPRDCIPLHLARAQGHRKEVLAGTPKADTNQLLTANANAAVIAPATWTNNGSQRFVQFSIWLANHGYGRPIQWVFDQAGSKVIPFALRVLIATGSKTKPGLAARTADQMNRPCV
jgi:hypothetical protein